VRTLLNRLVKKGVLAAQSDGDRNIYRPLVEQTRYASAGRAVRSWTRSSTGTPARCLLHFIKHEDLPPEQVERLKALLDAKGPKEEGPG